MYAVKQDAADDFFFGLRCALEVRPEIVALRLAEALGPQFDELADAIAEMRERRAAA